MTDLAAVIRRKVYTFIFLAAHDAIFHRYTERPSRLIRNRPFDISRDGKLSEKGIPISVVRRAFFLRRSSIPSRTIARGPPHLTCTSRVVRIRAYNTRGHMCRAARKLQSPAGAAGRLPERGDPGRVPEANRQFPRPRNARPINTRAFNLLIHRSPSAVGSTRWSAVWAR